MHTPTQNSPDQAPYRGEGQMPPAAHESTEGNTGTAIVPWGFIDEGGTIHDEWAIREMGDREDKLMGSPDADMTKIVCGCILGVGSITNRQILNRDVFPKLLKDDIDSIMVDIRILTFSGDHYQFRAKCGQCGTEDKYSYDLDQLTFKEAEDPEVRTQSYTSREDREVILRPLLATDNKMMERIHSAKTDIWRKMLALRLHSIDGVTVKEWFLGRKMARKPKNTPEWHIEQATHMMTELLPSLKDRESIRAMLKAARRGYHTWIELQCESCREVWELWMPVDAGFLKPSEGEVTRSGTL